MKIVHIFATTEFEDMQQKFNDLQHIKAAIQDLHRNPGDRKIVTRAGITDLQISVDVPAKKLIKELKKREVVATLEFLSTKAQLEAIFVI